MNNYKIAAALFSFCILFSCDKFDLVRTNPRDPKSKNYKLTIPELSTIPPYDITFVSAKLGGAVTSDGGATVTARGVCWNTSLNPTTANNRTTDGNGIGIFTSSFSGLTADTKYYARAYATNIAGTAYGNEISFTTQSIITDIDGNTYYTINIGEQIWMQENLKTTKYYDNTNIPYVIGSSDWIPLTKPAYCWLNNDISNKDIYGALYNWYTVDTKKLCPAGWHIPSDNEWKQLEMYLGISPTEADSWGNRSTYVGGQLKEEGITHWASPNKDATNRVGFTALPGGSLPGINIVFQGTNGLSGNWWSSTIRESSNSVIGRLILSYESSINRFSTDKYMGYSVRCVKD